MAKFNFYLKSHTGDKLTTINLRITSNSQSVFLSTGIKIPPSAWCKDKGSPYYQSSLKTKENPYPNEVNTELNRLLDTARRALSSINTKKPSPAEIKNRLLEFLNGNKSIGNQEKETSFFSFWDNYVAEKSNSINGRTNKLISTDRIKCINQTKSVIQDFENFTRFRVTFTTCGMDFYRKFSLYCSNQRGFRSNTFGKHICNIKSVLKKADILGIAVTQDFKLTEYRAPRELTSSIYLNEKEIDELIRLDLSASPHLSRTRDFFVIGCYTGLRWEDLTDLSKADFLDNDIFRIQLSKTPIKVTIPILDVVKPFFQKYWEQGRYVFPNRISNQKFNDQLKEISKMVPSLHQNVRYVSTIGGKEVTENYLKYEMVCSHTCRRSFATNMYFKGIKPYDIMKITGHRQIKQFYEYIKMSPDESANSFLEQYYRII
jgi:integrase